MPGSPMYPVGSGAPKSKVAQTSSGPLLIEFGELKQQRTRVTTAQVNAGFILLPAIPGVKWRIVDCDMIAIGGAAATATSVDLLGTKAAAASRPVVNAVAGLTRSTRLNMGSTADSVILADGASFTAHDANTSIKVTKQSGGSNLATATHIDVLLTYVADRA